MRERMGMSENLPEPSFNKFIKSRIIEVYDEEEAKKEIVSEASEAARQLPDNESIIFRIVFYDSESFECRFWLFQDKGFAVCRSIGNLLEYRRVYVEVLGATGLVATFDLERARSLGNEISTIPGGPRRLGEYVKSILEGTVEGERRSEPIEEVEEQASHRVVQAETVEVESVDVASVFERCVDIVGRACGESCPNNVEELLEKVGIVVLGRGNEYLCVLKDWGDCDYIFMEVAVGGEKVEKGCVDRSRALEMIRSKLDNGWELVDLSHLSR